MTVTRRRRALQPMHLRCVCRMTLRSPAIPMAARSMKRSSRCFVEVTDE